MATWRIQRVDLSNGWAKNPMPEIWPESGAASRVVLKREGVQFESETFAPVYREGESYQTERGDRIRIEQIVLRDDGQAELVTREAVDVGASAPRFVQRDYEEYGISDEERAAGDAFHAQYNDYVFQLNLANNYSEPYAPVSESIPQDVGVQPFDPGYYESEPTYIPVAQYNPAYIPPDTNTPVVGPPPGPTPAEQAAMDYEAYITSLEQQENEGSWIWNGSGAESLG